MSTPQHQGPRLPKAPPSRPKGITGATAASPGNPDDAPTGATAAPSGNPDDAPTGQPGVLERLKASRPGAAAAGSAPAVPPPVTENDGGTGRTDGIAPARETQRPALTVLTTTASRVLKNAGSTSGRLIRQGATATTANVRSWNHDVFRSVVVSAAAVACVLGSAAGVGAFGGQQISDAAGGVLAPDATLLAPAARAFSIWSAIYAGLILYTLYQWLPSQRTSKRQRRLGWVVASSMLLNLAWILSVQASMLSLSLAVILLLLGVLLYALRILNRTRPRSRWEGALVDVPLGLYLGWVIVAAAANIASVATAAQTDLFGWGGLAWALVGLAAVTLGTMTVCMTDRGRLSVAFATCWGLTWIGVERFFGEPNVPGLAFAAAFAVFLILVSAGSRRHSVDHNYRRWTRAQQDAAREPLDLLAERDPEDADR